MRNLNTAIANCAFLLTTSLSLNAKDDIYPFSAIDYTKVVSFVSHGYNTLSFSYASEFSLGLGADHELTTHWSISNQLSINYLSADFTLTDQFNQAY